MHSLAPAAGVRRCCAVGHASGTHHVLEGPPQTRAKGRVFSGEHHSYAQGGCHQYYGGSTEVDRRVSWPFFIMANYLRNAGRDDVHLQKLHNLGMTPADEYKLQAMRDCILKVATNISRYDTHASAVPYLTCPVVSHPDLEPRQNTQRSCTQQASSSCRNYQWFHRPSFSSHEPLHQMACARHRYCRVRQLNFLIGCRHRGRALAGLRITVPTSCVEN